MRWERESDYMPLHEAMSALMPEGFVRLPGKEYAQQFQDRAVILNPLASAHLIRFQQPGLFRNDPLWPADMDDRITSDLIHYWPMLAVRIQYIPGVVRMIRNREFQVPTGPGNYCSLFKLIADNTVTSDAGILTILKSLNL